ncbi:HNH endonuclease [Microaceticoccus formicicus]|uniref:HNH endonuclease n=1 Tax=Microaceticoccus formicicus TaxID=3118105 RepID=UPI003CD013AE|nr:HNH endonuclease [Peptoniphilaceae bacterium AMB_02]
MNYNKKSWTRKSDYIKQRDGYLCQECLRRGERTGADHVHHINPVETHSDLRWENDNLISLCLSCHNKMHHRADRRLTRLGRWYQRIYQTVKGNKKMTEIRFVIGPPCSGKSTYVKEHKGRNDIVYDLDEIVKAITLNELHDKNPKAIEYALDIRHLILTKLETETEFDTAWIISTEMKDRFYDYYLYKPQIIKMPASQTECLYRLHKNPDGRNVEETEKVIRDYFASPL